MTSATNVPPAACGNRSGMLSLYVGPGMSIAYHQLDQQARARVRATVKALFRETMVHENPALASLLSASTPAGKGNPRGLLKVVIETMRKEGRLMTVLEITSAVQTVRPEASSAVVRRLLNKCVDMPSPIMVRENIKNPNTVLHARREQVLAFALTPEVQRQRRSGSVVQDGQVLDSIVERVVQIVVRSSAPPTAREILRALKRADVSLANLHTYLSGLKRSNMISASEKRKEAGRLVNTYVPGSLVVARVSAAPAVAPAAGRG